MDPDRRKELFSLVADVVSQPCGEVDPVAAELIRAARALQPSLDYLLLERLLSSDAAKRENAKPKSEKSATPSGRTAAKGVRRPD